MTWFKRISLFVLTNIAVLVTISIALAVIQSVFGIQLGAGSNLGLLVLCAVWGFGGAFISLMMSKFIAKMSMGVQIIDVNTNDPRARDVLTMVYTLAKKAGLEKMPEVGIYDSPEINAFATGPSRNNSLVAVSSGLLGRMNRDEIEGVIGHELAHIANGDMVTMTLVQGVVNSFVMFFSRILANVISSQMDERGRHGVYIMLSIAFDIVFGILGSMVVAFYSRRREFRADEGGARFAGRDKMIAGLRRLQSVYEEPQVDAGGMAVLKISNKPVGIFALFSTHPPLEVRIRHLQEMR